MTKKQHVFAIGALVAAMLALVFSGQKTFVVWTQVLEVFVPRSESRPWLEYGVVTARSGGRKLGRITQEELNHAQVRFDSERARVDPDTAMTRWVQLPRRALLAPVVAFSRASGLALNLVFSVFCVMMLTVTGLLLAGPTGGWWRAASVAVCYVASIPMNGRLVFALLSGAALLSLSRRWNAWRLSTVLLLGSVSSGIFGVVYLLSLAEGVLGKAPVTRPGWLVLGLGGVWFLAGVAKNVLFFGDLSGLLAHGAGGLIPGLIAGAVVVLGIVVKRGQTWTRPTRLLIFSILGGMISWSNLVLALPALGALTLRRMGARSKT